jgi:hypothetical protein
MRRYVARALVRWVSGWWGTSYRMQEDPALAPPQRWIERSHDAARLANRIGLPVATFLHRRAAGQQMIEESWWG